jgi:hypothetical protein
MVMIIYEITKIEVIYLERKGEEGEQVGDK